MERSFEIGRFVSGYIYSGEKCFEPESESTDSARKAVEKLQADGKLVQMAKVIATVKSNFRVLLVFSTYTLKFWCENF